MAHTQRCHFTTIYHDYQDICNAVHTQCQLFNWLFSNNA